tara:strand:+ start:923 stop:1621 length:699 start_codon:yes stop_codon:yes gene_type:complete
MEKESNEDKEIIDKIFSAKTHCDVLQCDSSHANDEKIIKKSFRKMSLKVHPDKNKHEKAKDAFLHLTESYDYLIRYRIDANIQSKSNTSKSNWNNFAKRQPPPKSYDSKESTRTRRNPNQGNTRKERSKTRQQNSRREKTTAEKESDEFRDFFNEYQRKAACEDDDVYDSNFVNFYYKYKATESKADTIIIQTDDLHVGTNFQCKKIIHGKQCTSRKEPFKDFCQCHIYDQK